MFEEIRTICYFAPQDLVRLWRIKKVHFIGIGGIGTSAIAKMMLKLKKKVSGSDLVKSEITKELEKKGVNFFLGHSKNNLSLKTDLVIYSSAIPKNNPERKKAKELKIKQLSYPQILGEISKSKETIAISGTNGKSTTCALLGLILEKAGFDPLVIVGSKVKTFKEANFRFGKGKFFVVEACEWKANMLNLQPQTIVLTNIEEDHLDYYKNLEEIKQTFKKYLDKKSLNFLIVNKDDKNSLEISKEKKFFTYGINKKADLMAKNIKIENRKQKFSLFYERKKLENFEIKIPGRFNIYNSLAASLAALKLGVKSEIIKEVLKNFSGIWRRFEVTNFLKPKPYTLISDYAHHPTAIKETIKAAKEFYPQRKIFVVFQPHQHNRTKKLFKKFVSSFDLADLTIISEIYSVPGREKKEDLNITSKDLVREIKKRGKEVFYTKDLKETEKLILEKIGENDVVLIMGAGDIYKLKIKN